MEQSTPRGLSSTALKLIAITTMFIDHIGAVLIEGGILNGGMTLSLSDLESFSSGSVWWKTDLILRLIGRIEIPFDLAVYHTPFYFGYQNVFFTLFFALLALAGIRKWEVDKSLWKQIAAVVLCCLGASLLSSDYGAFGVVFVVLLYVTRRNPRMQTITGSLAVIWELTACLAFIPIRMYNGTKGKGNFKYLFYAFYPLHLLFLYGVWRFFFL